MKVIISIVLLIVLTIVALNMRVNETFVGDEIFGERLVKIQMSARGDAGPEGQAGRPGPAGDAGRSAFNNALEKAQADGGDIPVWAQGEGNRDGWIASLKGKTGDQGEEGESALNIVKAELLAEGKNAPDSLKSYLNSLQSNLLPFGTIVAYNPQAPSLPSSGINIPDGWAECNGEEVDKSDRSGTVTPPDLRGRFILGRNDTDIEKTIYNYGTDGGTEINEESIILDNIPSHTHGVDINVDDTSYTAGDVIFETDESTDEHSDKYYGRKDDDSSKYFLQQNSMANQGDAGAQGPFYSQSEEKDSSDTSHIHKNTLTQGELNERLKHNHNISVTGAGKSVPLEIDNMPPYYVLIYIMKI